MFLMSTNTLQAPKHSNHLGNPVVAVMMHLNGFESVLNTTHLNPLASKDLLEIQFLKKIITNTKIQSSGDLFLPCQKGAELPKAGLAPNLLGLGASSFGTNSPHNPTRML